MSESRPEAIPDTKDPKQFVQNQLESDTQDQVLDVTLNEAMQELLLSFVNKSRRKTQVFLNMLEQHTLNTNSR